MEKEGIKQEPRRMRVLDPMTGKSVLVNEMAFAEWEKKSSNSVEKPPISDTIEKTTKAGIKVQKIGRIDIEKYRVVSDKIRTDEVVITDERLPS